MKVRKIALLIFFLIGVTFQNCSDCDCCFDPAPDFFDVQGILVDHLDNDYSILDTNEVSFIDYGFLSLSLNVEYIVMQESNYIDFSLINTAYGCTPPVPGLLGSKEESIESLQIISINDFDEDHKAGDSIIDLLEFSH